MSFEDIPGNTWSREEWAKLPDWADTASEGRMDPEYKKLWVEALLSGKYTQGHGHLAPCDGQFCCLGVACDISGLSEWVLDEDDDAEDYRYYLDEGDLPPHAVQKKLGLPSENPNVNYHGKKVCLSDINDKTDEGFEGIARIIEEQL